MVVILSAAKNLRISFLATERSDAFIPSRCHFEAKPRNLLLYQDTKTSHKTKDSATRYNEERKAYGEVSTKPVDADKIAEMADQGLDISKHFTNQFTVGRPAVQRLNVDFAAPMLRELDREANTLNISRQAVIKTMLREALDRRYLAQQASQSL